MSALVKVSLALLLTLLFEGLVLAVKKLRRGGSSLDRSMPRMLEDELVADIARRKQLLEAAGGLLKSTRALRPPSNSAVVSERDDLREAWLRLNREVQREDALRSALYGRGEDRRFGLRQLSAVGTASDASTVNALIRSDRLEPASLALAERVAEKLNAAVTAR